MLDHWRALHEQLYGASHNIPSPVEIHLSKLEGGLLTGDTCNQQHKTSSLLIDVIEDAINKKHETASIDAPSVTVLQQDCHNHLCNDWIGAVTKCVDLS